MSHVTYKLKVPVQLSESSPLITELHFRTTVTTGDIRGLKVSDFTDPTVDALLKIAGRLCAQPDAVMNKLAFEDFPGVTEMVGHFLQGGRTTGTELSQS